MPMQAVGVLPDAGREPRGANGLSLAPIRLHQPCDPPCSSHGVCDQLSSTCLCQLGWAGDACERPDFPACRLFGEEAQASPELAPTCAQLRKLSPVACECIAQCVAAKKEICAPGSFGCQQAWKPERRGARRRWSSAAELTTRQGFFATLQCLAHPSNLSASVHSGLPPHPTSRLMSFATFARNGYDASLPPISLPLPAFSAGLPGRGNRPAGAAWLDPVRCDRGCSARGRCLHQDSKGVRRRGKRRGRVERVGSGEPSPSCVCIDGSYGAACEHVCSNDCFNDCSGHGECIHGWCRCSPGWFGVDCSDTIGLRYRRSTMHHDVNQFGRGPPDAQLHLLPPEVRVHAERLRRAVFVYDLPPSVNREAEAWMWRQWGSLGGYGCDPVYNRRIYAAQSHFDSQLLHDDFARTLDASRAKLFYVRSQPGTSTLAHHRSLITSQPSTVLSSLLHALTIQHSRGHNGRDNMKESQPDSKSMLA